MQRNETVQTDLIFSVTEKGKDDMERYVNIDKAIPMMIQACVDVVGHGITQVDAVNIARMLEDASINDVVPMSEVRKIIAEFDGIIDLVSHMIGIEIMVGGKYAELKKKYMERENEACQT